MGKTGTELFKGYFNYMKNGQLKTYHFKGEYSYNVEKMRNRIINDKDLAYIGEIVVEDENTTRK
jgi:hypothetical protein